MKLYIFALLGCLIFLVNSAYSSTESSSCPVQPETCFFYIDVIDSQVREIIHVADFVAEVTFTEDECFGKMHINKVHHGVLEQLNGTELRVALKPDCRLQKKWQPNEQYCLAVGEFQFEYKMITLDENVLLTGAPCAVSPRPQKRTWYLETRDLTPPVVDSRALKPNYMRNSRRSLVHRMAFEKGSNSLTDYYGSPFEKADSCKLRPTTCPVCRRYINVKSGKKILDYSDIIEANFEQFGTSDYKLNVSSVIKSSSRSQLADVYNFVFNYKCYHTCPEIDAYNGLLILMKDGGTRTDGCLAIDDKMLIIPHVQLSMFELKTFLYASDETWAAKNNPV